MSDFKAKMRQILFRLGLRPRPRWRTYSAPPYLLAGFKRPTSKEGEEKGSGTDREGKRRGGEGRKRRDPQGLVHIPPVFEILKNTLPINNLRYPRKFVAGTINSSSISCVSGHQYR